MPHGMCYLWQPGVLILHVASDSLIALAYFSIPITLLYFIRKRTDLTFKWVFVCFAVFIVACGATHLMEILVVWSPLYWLSGYIKVVTAAASAGTAFLLAKLMPVALALPSPTALHTANRRLEAEVVERQRADLELRLLNESLETRIAQRTNELEIGNRALRIEMNERKRTDDLLARILGSISDGVIVTDVGDRISFINDAAARLVGGNVAECTGRSLRAVLNVVDARGNRFTRFDDVVSSMESPSQGALDVTLISSAGTQIPIDLHAEPLLDLDSSCRGMVLTFRDFTERRRVQAELEKANASYAIASTAGGLGFWEWDIRSDAMKWDARMFQIYGVPVVAGDQSYAQWRDKVHPDDLSRTEAGLLEAADHGGQFTADFRIVRPNGEVRYVKASAGVTVDSGGSVVRVFGVQLDITSRQRTLDQMRATIEASPAGMIMTNSTGTIVMVNKQIEVIFGYTRAELLSNPVEMLIPSPLRAGHLNFRNAFLLDPSARVMGSGRDLYGRRKDGTEIPIEIGLSPLTTTDGECVLSSVVDITERRRGVEKLRGLNTELEKRIAERTAELKERVCLLQEVHHRVKNNLQVISSLINMQIRVLPDPSSKAALKDCQSRVETMALIHEMLFQFNDYANVPFAAYATSLGSRVFSASGLSPMAVKLQIDVDEILLSVDKAIPCGLILNELITNALKHAFPNDSIGWIRVEMHKQSDQQVLLVVSDNGIGFSSDVAIPKSTSLGLELIETLVEQLDGRLECIQGQGTTYKIIFPIESST